MEREELLGFGFEVGFEKCSDDLSAPRPEGPGVCIYFVYFYLLFRNGFENILLPIFEKRKAEVVSQNWV